jgi:hypothetical protein
MKKQLLIVAFAAAACSAFAAAPNHVVNGDFEDTNYVSSVPEGYTWDPWDQQQMLTELPGWTVDAEPWNGGAEIKTDPGDGDLRPEDDVQYLHIWGYNDNGWHVIKATQIVTGLVAGRTYTLSFLMAYNFPEGASWTQEANYGIVFIADVDGAEAGKEIVTKNITDLGQEFEECSFDFTPNDTQVWLQFGLPNYYGTDNKKDNLWMDLDMVSITSDEEDGIENVSADIATGAKTYYNFQGVRVANPTNGLYIVKQGNKVSKVAL